MNKMMKMLVLSIAAAGLAAPAAVNAAELRAVSCSVTVNYLLNNVVRAPYTKDFVVTPGTSFEHDFSTFTRFRYFSASTAMDADRNTVVSIDYYNDVGVFEAIDLRTSVTLRDDRDTTTAGNHSYWTSLGVVGDHTTDYNLTCRRLKD